MIRNRLNPPMRNKKLFLVSLGIFLFSAFCFGDYLEISRKANLYSQAGYTSRILETLERGAKLVLPEKEEQQNGYYLAFDPATKKQGWVYRSCVRRYRGSIEKTGDATSSAITAGTTETPRDSSRHLKIGKPQAVYERFREGYALAEDARLKIPLWVQYEISPEDLNDKVERDKEFVPDTSIPYGSRSELSDYQGSGFDKGHMAPAADMKRNQQVQDDCFLLSNIAPQIGVGFNRQIWQNLETAIRGWVEQRGTLTIITGPVFEAEAKTVKYQVIGTSAVAVPTHFYKIVVDSKNEKSTDALAFLLPNKDLRGHEFGEYLISIRDIEKLTGLDFLSALPKEVQDKVESAKATRIW